MTTPNRDPPTRPAVSASVHIPSPEVPAGGGAKQFNPFLTAQSMSAVGQTRLGMGGANNPNGHHRDSVWDTLLQRNYNPPFLSPSASLVHAQGPLRKFGSKLTLSSMNERHFVLSHHSLQYYKSDPFAAPLGTIALLGATLKNEPESEAAGLKPPPGPGCVWSITTAGTTASPARKYILVSVDTAEKAVWMDLLVPSLTEEKRRALCAQTNQNWENDVHLCLEGWLVKSGAELSSWTKRYFIYHRQSHTFAYHRGPPKAAGFVPVEPEAALDVVGKSHVGPGSALAKHSALALEQLPPGIDTLSILAYTQSVERCYVLLAGSKAERDEWIAAIKTAMDYRAGKGKSFDKQNGMYGDSTTRRGSATGVQQILPVGSPTKGPPPVPAAFASAASRSTSPPPPPAPGTKPTSPSPSSGPSTTPMHRPVGPPPIRPMGSSKNRSDSGSPPPPPAPKTPGGSSLIASPLAGMTAKADLEEDEWSAPGGRFKGESVCYVNLKAHAPARAPPKLSVGTAVPRALPGSGAGGSNATASAGVPDSGALSPRSPTGAPPTSPPPPVKKPPALASIPSVNKTNGDSEEDSDDDIPEPPSKPSGTPSAASSAAAAGSASPPKEKSSGNLLIVERSIMELYSTESTYVGILKTICTAYLLRFRKHLELGIEPRWFAEQSEYAQFTLFQHVETIRDINGRLLGELEAIQKSTPPADAAASSGGVTASSPILTSLGRIGSTFRQFIPFFKVYSAYAQTYDEQLKALDALAEKRSSLKAFLMLTDMCEGTTLASLMICPVQRVGRYVLLLETILRHVPGEIAGTKDIELALLEMRKVGILINETVALWEAKSKVVELQAKIDIPILAPGRFLVREGPLKKVYDRTTSSTGFFASHLGKKSDTFMFFLFNDQLVQCRRAAIGDRYTHRVTMGLIDMVLEDLPDAGEIKSSWSITYSTAKKASGAAAAAEATSPTNTSTRDPGESVTTSPLVGLLRPSSTTGNKEVPAALERMGSGLGFERKTLTVYAASSEEKSLWLNDLTSLIQQIAKNSGTLRR